MGIKEVNPLLVFIELIIYLWEKIFIYYFSITWDWNENSKTRCDVQNIVKSVT